MSDAIAYKLRDGRVIYYKDAAARQRISSILSPLEAESGKIIHFDYGDDTFPAKPTLSKITIRMNPKVVGEGTQSPDSNPFQISKWNSVSLSIARRNIIPSWGTYEQNSYIDAEGHEASSSGYKRINEYIPIEPNTKYYCSCVATAVSGAVTIPFYDENYNFISRIAPIGNTDGTGEIFKDFTTPENAKYIRFSIYRNKINLEISKLDNSSEAYDEPIDRTFTFTDAQNVYGGELSYLGSKQWLLKVTHTGIVLDGTRGMASEVNPSGWSVDGTAEGSNLFFSLPLSAKPDPTDRCCSHYPNAIIGRPNTLKGFYVYYDDNTAPTGMLSIRNHFADPAYADNDDYHLITYFEEYLAAQNSAGTPVTCYWKLLTPQLYIISEDGFDLHTGSNILSVSDGVIEELEYRADLDPDGCLFDHVLESIGNSIAPVEKSTVASKAYAKNDYLIFDDCLCKASSVIAAGATLAIGTNLTKTTIAEELKALRLP